jgi:glutathione S-transferase
MAILYGHPESGHTYKVALALELAGIPFEYRWVDVFKPREQRPADFQAASRHGEIPVLVDGVPLVQSNAILLHLADKHRVLGGESPATVALAREWLFWEANRIGISLPNLRHYLRFDDSAPPAGVLDWLRGRLQSDLQRLEKELSDSPWLLGAAPSVADIACFALLC